jgi:hypothetical protein
MAGRDWQAWHADYDDPDSPLAHRLMMVRGQIKTALDEAPAGPLRLISMVAGQGRDVIPVLAEHPRRRAVAARLVELDAANAAVARKAALDAGLDGVDVVTGDAALLYNYDGYLPAHIVLICGLFGNISDADIRRTVAHASVLTQRGGVVIWTRHRGQPAMMGAISSWFNDAGFANVWESSPDLPYGIAVHRSNCEPMPPPMGAKLFTFVN